MATKVSSDTERVYQSPDQVYSVIAAIDFGTSSSGYAFGFLEQGSDEIQLSSIQLNKWQIGVASLSTEKAPTTVLLKPDKTFDSFGYKAEDKYAKLCDTKKQMGWRYFEKFKMMLYKKKLTRKSKLKDAENKKMSAKAVFSAVIGHLKACVLEDVTRQNPSIEDDDILYILTVPAIWSDAAKQYMREAAADPTVKIKDTQLRLVLEPEAASVYCRQRKSRIDRESGNQESLEVGHKYIILDMGVSTNSKTATDLSLASFSKGSQLVSRITGSHIPPQSKCDSGGTADIATHEIIENDKLREIDYARGDNLGGQLFNENFFQFISKLFGEELFEDWRHNKHGDYLRLQRTIEGIKWKISDNDGDILVPVPYSLAKHLKNESVQAIMSEYKCNINVVEEDQYMLNNNFVKGFFDTIIKGITQHLNDICKNTGSIKTAFMVGGLAQSSYVQKNIQAKFPKFRLIVPEDPSVAVLKGAVMLGNKPQTIADRIARYSYGIGVNANFVEGKHDEKYKIKRERRILCRNVFKQLIKKGQVLQYGESFTLTTVINATMSETKQCVFETTLYQSTSENPSYVTEPDCTKLGIIIENPPEGGWPKLTKSEVKISVGEAEFRFHVQESSGREYETTVDFLSQKEGQMA